VSLLGRLRELLAGLAGAARASSVEMIAWEHRELEHLFALLVLGPAAGIPSPASVATLELLPHLERELVVLLSRARESGDPLAELVSTFDVT